MSIGRPTTAYPRGCGGANNARLIAAGSSGLSPRVRGSPMSAHSTSLVLRPIPAGAGEPTLVRRPWEAGRAYPRGCGGAINGAAGKSEAGGLSPRVRGSRLRLPCHCQHPGPIPAGAGEPALTTSVRRRSRAYPRGCGGALGRLRVAHLLLGLSPRVRGSRAAQLHDRLGIGPIPAGAGEPTSCELTTGPSWAYPRGCGGAHQTEFSDPPCYGLSPRVRGSQQMPSDRASREGPIPAGAGEPGDG